MCKAKITVTNKNEVVFTRDKNLIPKRADFNEFAFEKVNTVHAA